MHKCIRHGQRQIYELAWLGLCRRARTRFTSHLICLRTAGRGLEDGEGQGVWNRSLPIVGVEHEQNPAGF